MKRYELPKVGEGGLVYIEESDVLAVRPRKGDALHPVEIELLNRAGYTIEDGFRYNARTRTVTIQLSIRQAKELIEQDREAQGKDFCEGCFDFGASPDPDTCARCRVILALRDAGQGDCRKVRIPLPERPSYGLLVAFVVLFVVFWVTLYQSALIATERDRARQELAEFRSWMKPPAVHSPPKR